MKMQKYHVVYETGNPDYGNVVRSEAETMAVSLGKAISNIWWRTGRDQTFFVVRAVVV